MRKRFIAVLVVLTICLPLAALFSAHAAQVHLPFGIPFDTDYESLAPLFEEKTGVRLVAPEEKTNALKTPDGVFLSWEGFPAYISFVFQEDGSGIEQVDVSLYNDALPFISLQNDAVADEILHQQLIRLSNLFDTLDSRLGPANVSTMGFGDSITLVGSEAIPSYQFLADDEGMDTEKVCAAFQEHSFGKISKTYSNLTISIFFVNQYHVMGFSVKITYQSTPPSQEQWDEIMEYVSSLPQYP